MMGKYVFTLDSDHPLRKGNQVTQVGKSSVLDENSKNQGNKPWKPCLKTGGSMNSNLN